MKKESVLLIFIYACIVLGLILLGLSCNSFDRKPENAVLTHISYVHNLQSNDNRTTIARRIIKDTLVFTSIDSFTQKKKWVRDTFYYIPLTDTARRNGVPLLDSTGKIQYVLTWNYLPKMFKLEDYNKDWK